jgi:hypothetical protein
MKSTHKPPRMTLLALNEFNLELLKDLTERYGLKNLSRLLSLKHTKTISPDTLESDWLEPWSQWVTVHTGVRTGTHKVQHLGDVPALTYPQIWETLSDRGFSSGIWGAMNASRGKAERCLFFLPDPWTFSESAFPSELNGLIEWPRFVAKNRVRPIQWTAMRSIFAFLGLFIRYPSVLLDALKLLPRVIAPILRFREAFVIFGVFELLSVRFFLKMKQKYRPDFSMLFINTIAHLQHYYWDRERLSENDRYRVGFQLVDEMVGLVLEAGQADESILAMNAFSQVNTNDDEPYATYRPKDHRSFLSRVGISPARVEELMTADAHLFFKTDEAAAIAHDALAAAEVGGIRFFHVERDANVPLKLFYRPKSNRLLSDDAMMAVNGYSVRVADHFVMLGVRTGKHDPHGDLLANFPIESARVELKDVHAMILGQFLK